MDQHVIDFRDLDWIDQRPGVRFKASSRGSKRMRLVEFTTGTIEEDWCISGHIGYVLEGTIAIEFDGGISHFLTGDGIYIAEGNRHRASVTEGKKAVILFVEQV
jgi:hypothetical protein